MNQWPLNRKEPAECCTDSVALLGLLIRFCLRELLTEYSVLSTECMGAASSARRSCAQPSSVERKAHAQPPLSIGANPLMAYVPGGGMYTATDATPAAAPVKRAVKKGKAGGSCCC